MFTSIESLSVIGDGRSPPIGREESIAIGRGGETPPPPVLCGHDSSWAPPVANGGS